MTLGTWFYVLMLIWFVVGAWAAWPRDGAKISWGVLGGTFIPFLLFVVLGFVVLGFAVFGDPVK